MSPQRRGSSNNSTAPKSKNTKNPKDSRSSRSSKRNSQLKKSIDEVKHIQRHHVSKTISRLKASRKQFKLNPRMAKVCLIVIDGWGLSDEKKGNAILNANTPVMDKLSDQPGKFLTLDASGEAVGLPAGLMGNSEVGHLNIGAGRVMYQDILRINKDCQSGDIANNQFFVEACFKARDTGRLHILGLVSDGGVHGHIDHLFALLDGAKKLQVPNCYVHFFADGRDTPPKSALKYLEQLVKKMHDIQYGSIATIMGRYYAMDRDKRWERIKVAYDGLVDGIGDNIELTKPGDYSNVYKKIEELYSHDITDEFLKPIIIDKQGLLKDNDTLVFMNFRSDRMRQITETLGIKLNFEVKTRLNNLSLYTMNQYKKEFPFKMLYPPIKPVNVLAEAISTKKVGQFHCAETEKYAHVTFFFNGGQEAEFDGEDRLMVPSPRVATYDLDPRMNASGVADEMCKAMQLGKYQFVMCNFAPPDMVGHTGKYEPTIIACQATDEAIGKVRQACQKNGYILLITADHGNAEKMIDEKGGPVTSHTTNRVPFIMDNTEKSFVIPVHNAALCDVAPTVLKLMNIDKPNEMDGQSLV